MAFARPPDIPGLVVFSLFLSIFCSCKEIVLNSFYPVRFTSRRVNQLTPWFPSRQVWLAIAMMSISKPALSAASSFDLGNYLAPEISVQSAFTDGSQIKGHQGEVSSSSHQITLHNELLYFQYEQWDVDWEKVEQLPFGD